VNFCCTTFSDVGEADGGGGDKFRLGILCNEGMDILKGVDWGKLGERSVRGEPGDAALGGEGPPSPGLRLPFFVAAFRCLSTGGGGILLEVPVGASFCSKFTSKGLESATFAGVTPGTTQFGAAEVRAAWFAILEAIFWAAVW
jgi:hypothetical protein